jgi:hypothetical protein
MTRDAFSRSLLLVALTMAAPALCGQQAPAPRATTNLPDAPAPQADSQAVPVEEAPTDAGAPAASRSADEAIGQNQRNGKQAGFPPVSPPAAGGLRVPPAARPNIFGARSQCLPDSSSRAETVMSCSPTIPIFARFVDSADPLPLTSKQKLILTAKNIADPFNLLTIGAVSGFSIATNARSHYGPGFPGFAKNAGVAFTQDMTGEFFSTFLIPAIAHQDPHYHRMPNLSWRRRILHVVDEVVISQHDDGRPMFNYATVFGTIFTSSLGNLYVPGRKNSFGSSAARISTSFATDPIGNAITEFVPDLARHVNVQVVLVQRLINRVAIAEGAPPQ